MSKDPSEELDIGHHARRGTAWMVAMRWAVRLLGLLSTIVLARLLNPEDFGLFALSVLLIGLAELMGKAGQDMAVIRERDLSREYLDSAWTASILIGFAFGIVLILVAPWIAALFHEPRAELLVQILSARVFLMGFENIGVALFRRDLDFAKDFRFGVYEKLAQVVVTITLAVMFRNYWALVLGAIFGMMIAIAISYVMHPYRPRLCFSAIGRVWSFSGWMFASFLGMFFTQRLASFTIGATQSTEAMGYYHVGDDLGQMPTLELVQPISRALFPTYSAIAHDLDRLANAAISSLSVVAIIAFSIGFGFAAASDAFVNVVYGSKWDAAADVVYWSSIATGIAAFCRATFSVQQAAGNSKIVAQPIIRHLRANWKVYFPLVWWLPWTVPSTATALVAPPPV